MHIGSEYGWRGGEHQTLLLLRGLVERGEDAVLVCQPGSPLSQRAREAGIRVIELRMRNEVDLLAAWRLARWLRKLGTRIVHCHSSHAISLGLLARAFVRRRRPRVVAARRVDFSIFRHNFFGLNARKYLAADRVVAVSGAVKGVLVADGLPAEHVCVIHDGIDVEHVRQAQRQETALRERFGLAADDRVVVNVAALVGHKGHRHLVAAVPEIIAALPKARVLVCGAGKLADQLSEQARELGLGSALIFAGFQPHQDIPAIIKLAEVFAFSSIEEGLGSVLLDVMAAGTPIVATNAGGIPEIVEHGKTGLIVDKANPQALAAGVIELLSNRSMAAELSEQASAYATRYGCYERMVEETCALYDELG